MLTATDDVKSSRKKIHPALELLLEASDYARRTTGDAWEFAVDRQLRSLGLTSNDFRYLVRKGLVEHAREMTIVGQDGRKFQQTGDLTFTKRTCFVLTSNGVASAREASETKPGGNGLPPTASAAPDGPAPTDVVVPNWDPDKRELRIDGRVVKRFKWHAVVAVGYRNNHFDSGADGLLVRNSWGSQWGDNGYGWLPVAYVRNQLARDFWGVVGEEWANSGELSRPIMMNIG